MTDKKLTDIDKAMEMARKQQEEEIRLEQVRMERLHVATMVLSGLAESATGNIKIDVEKAIEYTDELLERLLE